MMPVQPVPKSEMTGLAKRHNINGIKAQVRVKMPRVHMVCLQLFFMPAHLAHTLRFNHLTTKFTPRVFLVECVNNSAFSRCCE